MPIQPTEKKLCPSGKTAKPFGRFHRSKALLIGFSAMITPAFDSPLQGGSGNVRFSLIPPSHS